MIPTSLPTRVFAGVTVPDTPLIEKAIAFARKHSDDFAFNHIQRSWLFGQIIISKLSPFCDNPDFDHEAYTVAALLHDLGWDPTLVSTDKRFEIDGADAAREFLQKETCADPSWDKHRLQLVWDAIALHSTGSIALHKELEVRACNLGISADFLGPDGLPFTTADGQPLMTWDEYETIVRELPRLGLVNKVKCLMNHLCLTKPETTYDNAVGEWGEKHVEGYSRDGKLLRDLFENCDLDERVPS